MTIVISAITIPIAFASMRSALYSWILIWPLDVFAHRKLEPDGADEYL